MRIPTLAISAAFALLANGDVAKVLAVNSKAVYRLALRNIFVSHSNLVPMFSPEITDYTVTLDHVADSIAITPEIDQSLDEYKGGEDFLPVVTVQWKDHVTDKPESASLAIRKQIDLPDDGAKLRVSILVANPKDTRQHKTYTVTVVQSKEPLAILKSVDGVDSNGNAVIFSPAVSEDSAVYALYVRPDAKYAKIQFVCSTGSWVNVDGKSVSNGNWVTLYREKDHHKQIVEVTCGKGGVFGESVSTKYIFGVVSDYQKRDIPKPRLVVDSNGQDCSFDTKTDAYRCPDPKDRHHKTRVIGYSDTAVRYTIESPNKEVEVRLLNALPSIPFTYRKDLYVVGQAGQFNVKWPIYFKGAIGPSFMRVLGWILAILLAVLLMALLAVVGLSNVLGIGVPFGATEIAATLTLLIQYFCFANFMRGSTVLTEMTESLKWVTLFWPLPWHMEELSLTAPGTRHLLATINPRSGIQLWGDSLLGDVTDVRNACGCLYWSAFLFLGVCIIHGGVLFKFLFFDRNHTFPHRLRIGNWESRTLHWLAFPVCTAASMILGSPLTAPFWKAMAGVAFAVYGVWISWVLVSVRKALSNERVCWVWNSSVREDGELEDESGYWSDVVCDQLLTQPVNRSLCKWFFPWKWISTVADIEPVNINPDLFTRRLKDDDVYPPRAYGQPHHESSHPMGKNPKTVEIVRTRKPGGPCPGQRLIAGLLRTQWLDILFTYQGVCRFHTQVVRDGGRDFVIPLTVKTTQLAGSIAAGSNAFFFDGARIPFVRIADTLFRSVLGGFLGIALASFRYQVDAAMLGSTAALSMIVMAYAIWARPYSRRLENWLIASVLLVIGLSAWSFMGYAIRQSEPSTIADIFLWFVAIVCFVLAGYSCVVTFSVFSALICPPLEETRFLEKLANCNVTISDHHIGWAVDVPAYSKYGCRDVKASCVEGSRGVHVTMHPSGDEPTLEFSSKDLKHACRSGSLNRPVMAVFAPAHNALLGYRHTNLYDRPTLASELSHFLDSDYATKHAASSVAQQIARQVELRGRGTTILSVTVVPASGHRERSSSSVTGSRSSANRSTSRTSH